MTRAFGPDLQRVIAASTGNRLSAFFSGIGVTALLQSSTAAALIIATFCERGAMSIASGIAVMLGADVGTTIVAQILSFDMSWLFPLLITAGFIMFTLYDKRPGKIRHIGKILIGIGLVLLALNLIKDAVVPLKESETLPLVLKGIGSDVLISVLLAALLTWMMHSSLAMVLLLASLVASDVLPVHVGFVMVLGANLGGVMAPLMATIKTGPQASRVPVANLLMRFTGVVLCLPFVDVVRDALLLVDGSHTRLIVNFHMAFNIALAMMFLPFTRQIAALCQKIIPDRPDIDNPATPQYLDERELGTPSIALSLALRETLRMADIVQSMLDTTIKALQNNDEKVIQRVQDKDDVIDSIYKAIKMYMAKMAGESLNPEEAHQYMQILSFATNLESVGDIIDKSLMEMAQKKISHQKTFSHEGWEEIKAIHGNVMETMRLAQNVFVSEDPVQARRLIEGKRVLREKEAVATAAHIDRIREGVPETITSSSLHLDIIRDYRRINSFMASVAYPILDEVGQLRGSPLKPLKKDKNPKKSQQEGA